MPTFMFSIKILSYAVCNLCKLFGSEAQFGIAEEHVALLLQGDEVDVCMRHLHAEHGHANALAGECSLLCAGNLLGKEVETCQFIVFEVIDVVYFAFGNHEGVSLYHGVDVEECKVLIVLCHLIDTF